ncbi:MAG: DNA-3-methyladenine glycosylase [Candidatus Paceibacteria bacterium]
MRLKTDFFNRDTVTVARDLLGKYLCRRIGGKIIRAKIIETEAYCGQRDLACHASKGLTKRTKVMFGPPGHAYVYLIYGMYHCFNVVTREKGQAEAVLIRAAIIQNAEIKNQNNPKFKFFLDGPGKLCRTLKIDDSFNSVDLCKSKEIWLEDRGEKPTKIKRGKRIGVDYAGKWKDKLWRFYL